MDRWFAQRLVGEMRPGDHACLAFATAEEQARVVGAFVADGLATNERVVYFDSAHSSEVPGLQSHYGVNPQPYLSNGRLRVISTQDTCMTGRSYDPRRLVAIANEEVLAADRDGLRSVRFSGDLSWVLRASGGGPRTLLAGEDETDATIAPSTMAMMLCQYDQRQCTPEEISRLRACHEVLVEANPVFKDGVLTISPTFEPYGLSVAGEIDPARHAVFRDALIKIAGYDCDIHLNLSQLDFIDLAGLRLLATFGIRMSNGRRLVLDNAPPYLRELMTLVGGPHMLPGLVLGDPEYASRRTAPVSRTGA
jgi:anti-anti-sigma regulatory factor